MRNEIEDFTTLIREIANEEIDKQLKENGICRTINGTIVGKNNETGKYKIDIVDGYANEVLNQSGTELNTGDSVIISEKYGSNLSNCIISSKNNTKNDGGSLLNDARLIYGTVTEIHSSSTTTGSDWIEVNINSKIYYFYLSPSKYEANSIIPILQIKDNYYCLPIAEGSPT